MDSVDEQPEEVDEDDDDEMYLNPRTQTNRGRILMSDCIWTIAVRSVSHSLVSSARHSSL